MERPDFSGLFLLQEGAGPVALEKAGSHTNIGFNSAPDRNCREWRFLKVPLLLC